MRETEILRGLNAGRAKTAPKLDPRDNIPVMVAEGEAILPDNTVEAMGGPESVARLIEETNGLPPKKGLRAGHGYVAGGVGDRLGNMWQGVKDKVGRGAGKRPTPNAVNAQTQSVSGPGQDAASPAQRINGPKAPLSAARTAKAVGGTALRNLGTAGSAITAGDDLGMVWSHPTAGVVDKVGATAEALGNTAGGFLLDRASKVPGLNRIPGLKTLTAVAGPGSTVASGFRPVTAISNLVNDRTMLQQLRDTHPALSPDITDAPAQQAQPPAQPKLNNAESGSIGTDPAAQSQAAANTPQNFNTDLAPPAAQSLAQAARDRRITSQDMAPGTGFVVRTDSPGGGGTFINAPKPEAEAAPPKALRDQLIDNMLNSRDRRTSDRAQRALQALDNDTTQLEVAKLGRTATDTASKRVEELIEGSSNQFVDPEGKPDLQRNIELANFMRSNMPTFTIDGKTLESSDLTAQQRQKLITDMRAAFLASKNADDAVNSQWIGAPGHSNERVTLGDRLRKSSLGDIGEDGVGFAPLYDWNPLSDDRVLNTSRGLVRAEDYIGSGEGAADRRAEVAAIEQNSRRLGSYR